MTHARLVPSRRQRKARVARKTRQKGTHKQLYFTDIMLQQVYERIYLFQLVLHERALANIGKFLYFPLGLCKRAMYVFTRSFDKYATYVRHVRTWTCLEMARGIAKFVIAK